MEGQTEKGHQILLIDDDHAFCELITCADRACAGVRLRSTRNRTPAAKQPARAFRLRWAHGDFFCPYTSTGPRLHRGEGPALRSMFTGHIPLEHVRHHNPLWFAKLTDSSRCDQYPLQR